MGKNDISLTCRISARFMALIDAMSADVGESVSRGDVVILLLRSFSLSPANVTRVDAIELREPLTALLQVIVPPDLYGWLQAYAEEINEPISYVIRMAIYVELKKRGAMGVGEA